MDKRFMAIVFQIFFSNFIEPLDQFITFILEKFKEYLRKLNALFSYLNIKNVV